VLRDVLVLPITFRDSGAGSIVGGCSCCGGLDCIISGVTGMTGDVGGSGDMTRGACGGYGRWVIGVAGGCVGRKCCFAYLAHS